MLPLIRFLITSGFQYLIYCDWPYLSDHVFNYQSQGWQLLGTSGLNPGLKEGLNRPAQNPPWRQKCPKVQKTIFFHITKAIKMYLSVLK